MFEPRGHSDMYGAILLNPHRDDADICLLFMHNEGYSTMCGHGTIAVDDRLDRRGLFPGSRARTTIRFEVPAGWWSRRPPRRRLRRWRASGWTAFVSRTCRRPRARVARGRARRVLELKVRPPTMATPERGHGVGGAYYGIVDAASLGMRVVPEQASALRRAGAMITEVLRRDHTPTHPTDPDLGLRLRHDHRRP
jgi:trans-L-3-hydroxyproline dehydratase